MSDDESETDEIILAGERPPFLQVGMIVRQDGLTQEVDTMIVTDILDTDANDGCNIELRDGLGCRHYLTSEQARALLRLVVPFDPSLVYTGRWAGRGLVAEIVRDA